jgi:Lectin C-type domain
MRTIAMCLVFAATASAGCLRSTEFKCSTNADCGTSGSCEANGFCSVSNPSCAGTGRSYGDSAGQGLANTCVSAGNPGLDAGIDAPKPTIDAPGNTGCPSGYNSVAGSAHLYKRLTNVSWDTAESDCKLTSASAYLAIPDDATELMNLATVATGTPFWIGIRHTTGIMFVTQKNVQATFLPWVTNPPDTTAQKDCVEATSGTQITTEKCNVAQIAVCECEP